MSLKLARFRKLTSVGEIAGFLAAWMVGLWVVMHASREGDRAAPPSSIAAADKATSVTAIK